MSKHKLRRMMSGRSQPGPRCHGLKPLSQKAAVHAALVASHLIRVYINASIPRALLAHI